MRDREQSERGPRKPRKIRKPPHIDDGKKKSVFLMHGHDIEMREIVARFIEFLLLQAIILQERAGHMPVIHKLKKYGDVAFAIGLLSPDDMGAPAAQPCEMRPRARQNVWFEMGYFIGRLGLDRVCVLIKSDVEIPSDYDGVTYIVMDEAGGWKIALARELMQAGLPIDPARLLW